MNVLMLGGVAHWTNKASRVNYYSSTHRLLPLSGIYNPREPSTTYRTHHTILTKHNNYALPANQQLCRGSNSRTMTKFTPNPDVFSDESVLNHDVHTPCEFPGREQAESDYIDALQPVIDDNPPNHIMVRGRPGTGKTSMTKYLLAHLEEDCANHGIDVSSLYVNLDTGKNGTSSYHAAVKIANKARELRHEPEDRYDTIKPRGHSEHEVYNKLFDELNAIGDTILIVLDEIHELTDDSLLYQLPRASTNGNLDKGTHVGIIGISNNPDALSHTSNDVDDAFNPDSVRFGTYSTSHLTAILRDRAAEAYYDDAIESSVVPYCAARVASRSSSAREAIDLLHKAGKVAKKNGDSTVTDEHVKIADDVLERDAAKESLRALTTQEKCSLLAIATKHSIDHEPTPTRELYQQYQKCAEACEYNVLSENRFADRLQSIEHLRLTGSKIDADGGRQRVYWLDTNYAILIETLGEINEEFTPILEVVSRNLRDNPFADTDQLQDIDIYQDAI